MEYKLIKEYPGSPQLGTITEVSNTNTPIWYNVGNWKEFWEEVVEKDYEILVIEPQTTNPCCERYNIPFPNYPLKDSDKIISVKRLSDGEIFTIGDKTHLTNGNYYNFELKEFKFFHNGESGHLEKHRNKTFLKAGIVSDLHKEPTFFYLEDIVKTKQPLFTTEDSVDIFEGDKYCYFRFHSWTCDMGVANENFYSQDKFSKNSLYFSTKEAAEEYIFMNKPCLSLADVASIYKGINKKTHHPSSQANQLKEIVKFKLKI